MATSKAAKADTPRLGTIILLGAATGAIAWLPVMWLNIPVEATSAVADRRGPNVASPSTSTSVEPTDIVADQSSPPNLLSELPTLPGGAIPIGKPSATSPLRDESVLHSVAASADPDVLRPASAVTIDRPMPARPLVLAEVPADPPYRLRLGEEGKLPAEVKPASVIQASPAEPVVEADHPNVPVEPARVQNDESETLGLMHDLNDDDAKVAEAAAEALIQRGFTASHLKLARQLTSRRAEDRTRLARQLPLVSDIDSRLWLTWLLRDEVAEVRLAALSVLATTGDAETLRRAVEIARQDRDPRVRQQLEQIEKQRQTTR